MVILISDKLDFKIKAITRDKEGHYIMIKGSTQEEIITSESIYATNIEAPQCLRPTPTSIKGEISRNLQGLPWVVAVVVDLCVACQVFKVDQEALTGLNKCIQIVSTTLYSLKDVFLKQLPV